MPAIDSLEKVDRDYLLAGVSPSASVIKLMVEKGLGIGTMAASVLQRITLAYYKRSQALPLLPAVDIVIAVTPTPSQTFSAKSSGNIK